MSADVLHKPALATSNLSPPFWHGCMSSCWNSHLLWAAQPPNSQIAEACAFSKQCKLANIRRTSGLHLLQAPHGMHSWPPCSVVLHWNIIRKTQTCCWSPCNCWNLSASLEAKPYCLFSFTSQVSCVRANVANVPLVAGTQGKPEQSCETHRDESAQQPQPHHFTGNVKCWHEDCICFPRKLALTSHCPYSETSMQSDNWGLCFICMDCDACNHHYMIVLNPSILSSRTYCAV